MKDFEVEIAVRKSEHKALDRKVRRLRNRPGHCATELRELKAQKLRIKEALVQLEREQADQLAA